MKKEKKDSARKFFSKIAQMENPSGLVEHFFRHEYGRMVGRLVHRFGAKHLDLIEDSIQFAMQKALRNWGRDGLPREPEGWLYTVSVRAILDVFRKEKTRRNYDERQLITNAVSYGASEENDYSVSDASLRTLFLACSPGLNTETQLALTLKLAAGFGVNEIASALLCNSQTIQKRITRGKEKLRSCLEIESIESLSELNDRFPSVITTIYLMFNEGYYSVGTDQGVQKDLCSEAIRLATLLTQIPSEYETDVFALLAMMLFHFGRFDARVDKDGRLVLLEEQDRSRWNWGLFRQAIEWMARSAHGSKVSRYHIEAAIAWEHCRAPRFTDTDWNAIWALYKRLEWSGLPPSGWVGWVMAQYFVQGIEAAFQTVLQLPSPQNDFDTALRYSLIGWLNMQEKRFEISEGLFRRVLNLDITQSQRHSIESLIARCTSSVEN